MHECSVNIHWRPYIARCLYCTANYTVIGRMETMEKPVNLESVPGVWPAAAPRRTG